MEGVYKGGRKISGFIRRLERICFIILRLLNLYLAHMVMVVIGSVQRGLQLVESNFSEISLK